MQGIPKSAIFMDRLSGAKTERPGLTKCLETLRDGDILVVWRLDCLGRSMRHLITVVEDLRNKGIGFRSLNEGAIDTTCASGELIFNIFSALAQFERRLIQERTKAGLAAARARGRCGGRPKVCTADTRVVLAKKLCTRTRAWISTRSTRRCGSRARRSTGTSHWTNRLCRAGRDGDRLARRGQPDRHKKARRGGAVPHGPRLGGKPPQLFVSLVASLRRVK